MGRFVDRLRAMKGGEQRAFSSRDDALAALLSGGVAFQSGQIVSPRTAENLSTVLACVGAISSALSSLPLWVYRRTEAGRVVDEQQPWMRPTRQGANVYQSWADFVEWLIASTLLTDNGLAEVVFDNRGAAVELRPIPWSWAAVQMLPNGRLAFDVSEQTGVFGTAVRGRRRLLQGEVLLLTDRSDDGILGVSRLRRAASVIGAALGQQEFAAKVLSNGLSHRGHRGRGSDYVGAKGTAARPVQRRAAEAGASVSRRLWQDLLLWFRRLLSVICWQPLPLHLDFAEPTHRRVRGNEGHVRHCGRHLTPEKAKVSEGCPSCPPFFEFFHSMKGEACHGIDPGALVELGRGFPAGVLRVVHRRQLPALEAKCGEAAPGQIDGGLGVRVPVQPGCEPGRGERVAATPMSST